MPVLLDSSRTAADFQQRFRLRAGPHLRQLFVQGFCRASPLDTCGSAFGLRLLLPILPRDVAFWLLAVQLIQGHLSVLMTDDRLGGLPDLQDIVLGSTSNQPWVVGVPAEVSKVIGVAAVHKETRFRGNVSK